VKKFGLYKKEKLCSSRAVEILFSPGGAEFSRLCYPLRAVARRNALRKSDAPVAFLITVPKKRLRHAVDRVQMRRRIRESYRLNHHDYPVADSERIDLGLVYVADKLMPYSAVEKAMKKILSELSAHFSGKQ
jgi:ribonuclease P protein component